MTKRQKIRSHFKKRDKVIYSAMQNLNFDEWIKPHNKHNGIYYFQRICRSIIGQQLSGKVASTINSRFEELFDKKVTPKKLLKVDDEKLRKVGMSWAKASYVKNVAEAYLNKKVRFNELNKMDDGKIMDALVSIKGIGTWTVEMFLIFTLGREDVFSFGDLGLKNGFTKLYKVEDPSKDQIEKVILKWKPFRTYGSIALWNVLDAEVVEANKKARE